MQCPYCLVCVDPCISTIGAYGAALSVLHSQGCRLFSLCVCEISEAICFSVEDAIVEIRITQNVAVWQQGDVAYAVGCHVTSVAYLGLEGAKFITVISTQSVPCGEPHKSLLILQELCDVARCNAIVFVVSCHITKRLRLHGYSSQQEQQI